VSFTGSTAEGSRVAARYGQIVKNATLEFGGKSETVVHEDANLDRYMPRLSSDSLQNAGQVCVSSLRISVPRRAQLS
jgi:acyl-CoA reductase-like NAD-dependent aldehyde dehydrogenase